MKQNHALRGLISGLLLLAAGTTTTTSHAGLILDFDSANYNAAIGVWSDTSGNNDNAFAPSPGNKPTLTPNATPTGQPALTFTQAQLQYLDLSAHLDSAALTSSPSFTLLAVARKVDASYGLLLSGDGNVPRGIGYRLDGGNGNRQTLTKNNVTDIGSSVSATASGNFHLFGVTYDGTTARFFLDGVADGTAVNSQTFDSGIWQIGVQAGTGAAAFVGDIAALDVYDTVLSGAALASAQNALMNTYTAVPEPGTALFGVALVGMAAVRRRRAAAV